MSKLNVHEAKYLYYILLLLTSGLLSQESFYVKEITDKDYRAINCKSETGDYRGGIAVTKHYVYVVGNKSTARYSNDLDNPVRLPRRDGIFSDLGSGELYTFSDHPDTLPSKITPPFEIKYLIKLNADLTKDYRPPAKLSSPATLTKNSGIFVSAGFLIVWDRDTGKYTKIDIKSGKTDQLGSHRISLKESKSWASWGIAELKNDDYRVIYRNESGNYISRTKLSSGNTKMVKGFNDIRNLASITCDPRNQRWYYFHENKGQFGGGFETVGYAGAKVSTWIDELQLLLGIKDTGNIDNETYRSLKKFFERHYIKDPISSMPYDETYKIYLEDNQNKILRYLKNPPPVIIPWKRLFGGFALVGLATGGYFSYQAHLHNNAYIKDDKVDRDLYNTIITENQTAMISYGVGGMSVLPYILMKHIMSREKKFNSYEDRYGIRLLKFGNRNENFYGISLPVISGNSVTQDFAGINLSLFTSGSIHPLLWLNPERQESFTGISLAVLVSTAKDFKGLSISPLNSTLNVHRGFQIGLINYSQELHGIQIGLLNIAKNARFPYLPLVNLNF